MEVRGNTTELLEQKIASLKFHQRLLMKMVKKEGNEFFTLVIEEKLSEMEVQDFYKLCETLSKEYKEQKADKFVFFFPLFKKFIEELNPKLDAKETIIACLKQKLYPELMEVLEKNL
ncbi:DUF1878 family protein [Heyndrickxia acidicola]|uniref:DUF1878 family protein n=1 Tax=Heyndrickxia acidicola TaxID=209389 RepID=A0ABU6MDC3_9BACI|nr:DUF1878 family protein [Heyndrickxia acidicola]MED1202434.1 DUF1878 family protein [Heyndrickxia acidicola]